MSDFRREAILRAVKNDHPHVSKDDVHYLSSDDFKAGWALARASILEKVTFALVGKPKDVKKAMRTWVNP